MGSSRSMGYACLLSYTKFFAPKFCGAKLQKSTGVGTPEHATVGGPEMEAPGPIPGLKFCTHFGSELTPKQTQP